MGGSFGLQTTIGKNSSQACLICRAFIYFNSLLITAFSKSAKKDFANDNDKRVVTVQEQSGLKTVFYGNCTPINNYYITKIKRYIVGGDRFFPNFDESLYNKSIIEETDDYIRYLYSLKRKDA